ncbi:hypothetical protein lerEdw1_011248 [Lerista edwardsae]|nr:hypothetical protein lerEdw1_011248 [Lerista edwardsae]
MEKLAEILPTLGEEEEAVSHRKLAASYCALMDHEVAAVRAAAIRHLGHLKRKSTVPQSRGNHLRNRGRPHPPRGPPSGGYESDTGLYEQLESLPAQLQPHVDSQEDLTFLWDMFGEKSLYSPVKVHEKLHYYEKQNAVPMWQGTSALEAD